MSKTIFSSASWQVLLRRIDVGLPHVHGHALDRVALFLGQGGPEAVKALLLAMLGHVKHPAAIDIVDHGHVAMPFAEGFLVDADVRNRLRLTPCQPPLDRPFHDPVHLVPTQPHAVGHRLLARRGKPIDHQPLKKGREPAMRLRPGNLNHPDAMRFALGPRQLRMQHRPVLAGVQVTPRTLGLMIVERTGLSTLRAGPVDHSWCRR